jgi:hypothetical protein
LANNVEMMMREEEGELDKGTGKDKQTHWKNGRKPWKNAPWT